MTTVPRAISADQLQAGMVYAVPERPEVKRRAIAIRIAPPWVYIVGEHADPLGGGVGEYFSVNRPLLIWHFSVNRPLLIWASAE